MPAPPRITYRDTAGASLPVLEEKPFELDNLKLQLLLQAQLIVALQREVDSLTRRLRGHPRPIDETIALPGPNSTGYPEPAG